MAGPHSVRSAKGRGGVADCCAAVSGDFARRLSRSGKTGFFVTLEGMNRLMGIVATNLEDRRVLNAIARGDLTTQDRRHPLVS